jgi:heptosyltransferase-2
MDKKFTNILIIQTAFIGDAILTLPLIQVLKSNYSHSSIDVIVIPRTSEIFINHPAISRVICYDKHGIDKGIQGFLKLRTKLISKKYELIIVPHRSLRSALLAKMLKPICAIGFDRSVGRYFFHLLTHYNPSTHEIERNLSLLEPLNIGPITNVLPRLYPSNQDAMIVDHILKDFNIKIDKKMIAIAPGTIWNSKRWPKDRFATASKLLSIEGYSVVLIGGKEDSTLCNEIIEMAETANIYNIAGRLSLLQSAELVRRCRALISNDSAPMHLAVAVGTPVIAIFGATIPEFGFAPRGPEDIVLETKGLKCRPCSIHGGNKCPIKTFECMLSISPQRVVSELHSIITKKNIKST